MQEQYRKGLALGLTMAEVMILLLFGLLLALVHSVNEQRVAKQMLEQIEKKYDNVPEDWSEIIAGLEKENRELREKNKDLEKDNEQLTEENDALWKLLGRRPCWMKAVTTPYYSFDVDVTREGYEFRRQFHSNLDADSIQYDMALHDDALMLHDDITTGQVSLSLAEMQMRTTAIDKWSKNQECVFYVRLRDCTGRQGDKEFWKERRKAVENVFYLYRLPDSC